MSISVSILESGTARIRPSQRTQSSRKSTFLRRLTVLTDRAWTEPLPINSYLISHPEGHILFDTGESPRTMEPGYFPWWMIFFHLSVDLHVRRHEGIRALLAEKGLKPTDLKAVVLSHLHHDHADGVVDLEGADIYVTADEWKANESPFKATMNGAVPQQWGKNFKPKFLKPNGGEIGPWSRSYPITSDGKIVAVDTPGHTPGHVCLIVYADETTYVLGGDVTYDQQLLDMELTDGVNADPQVAVESLRKIKEFASMEKKVVILPSHDPNAARRLANNEIYTPHINKHANQKEYARGHDWLFFLVALLAIYLYWQY